MIYLSVHIFYVLIVWCIIIISNFSLLWTFQLIGSLPGVVILMWTSMFFFLPSYWTLSTFCFPPCPPIGQKDCWNPEITKMCLWETGNMTTKSNSSSSLKVTYPHAHSWTLKSSLSICVIYGSFLIIWQDLQKNLNYRRSITSRHA